MHHDPPPPLLIGIIVVMLLLVFLRKSAPFDSEEVRRRKLAALAQKLRLQFSPKNDFKLAERFLFLTWLNRGEARNVRYAYNVMHGYHLDYLVTVFDYTFLAGRCSYYWSSFVLEMKTNFPDTIISHENLESRFAEEFGLPHIAFESAEFTRTFLVRSADKKFAFDVCHPRMMEYLLANKDLTVEIRGGYVAVIFEDWLRSEKVEFNLSRLIEIRKLFPQYLFTNA
jgi:uncharacterized protein DUF3137